jgi:hypothetical protein
MTTAAAASPEWRSSLHDAIILFRRLFILYDVIYRAVNELCHFMNTNFLSVSMKKGGTWEADSRHVGNKTSFQH